MSYEGMIGRKFNDVVEAGTRKVSIVYKKAGDQPTRDGNTNENYYDKIEEPEEVNMCGAFCGDPDDY